MRLALIYLGRRGAGIPISYELADHLTQHARVLVALSEHVENLHMWQESGMEIIITDTYQNLPGAVWSWVNQQKIKRLSERIRLWNPDVILFPMFYTWNPFLQWHLRQIAGVVAVHDPLSHPGLADFAYRLLEDASIRQAERCIVFSQSLAPDLSRRGIAPQRIDFVPLGEFSYYQRHASEMYPREGSDTPRLLFFGRITAYKGLDVLLQAYKQLSASHQAQLMIIGEGNLQPYRSLLDELSQVQLVNRWVNEDEIASYFNQSDIVILPYTAASQSGVLPIAASFGLPVIATRVGGIPEQIEDGVSGLLVAPGSVSELTAAIRRLVEDPQLAHRLGENLQRDYLENKSWDKIASRFFEICSLAAQQRRSKS